MKKHLKDSIAAIVGALLLIAGLLLQRSAGDPAGLMRTLPYLCIGLGCGAFGHGMGSLVSRRALKRCPQLQKQMEVERNDERNIALASLAKAKAFDMMIFVFGALMVCFALMNIALSAILLLVFAYLFVVGCSVYYRQKLDKEM